MEPLTHSYSYTLNLFIKDKFCGPYTGPVLLLRGGHVTS